MAVDISIDLTDTDHPLSLIGSITRSLGVNIRGVCAYETAAERVVHLLLEDEVDLGEALSAHGVASWSVTDVVVLDLEDRPGVFESITAALDRSGIRLKFAFTSGVWLVLGSEDAPAVRAALTREFQLGEPEHARIGPIKSMDPSVAALIDSGQ